MIKPIPELTCVLPLEQAVEFSVSSYDGQSVAGVPFEISLSSGLISEFAVVENGYLKLIIDQISPGYTSGLLKAELKIEDIFNTDQLPSFFNFDKSISIPVASKPLKVFINGEEFNLGKKSELPIILPVLSDHFLKKYNAVKVRYKEESDIAISIKSESKKGNIAENEWGIYKAFSECILMVTLTSEDLNLYMGTLHHVQAGDFTSHQSAGSKALKNLTIEIINTLLPEMDNILLKI